MSLSKPFFNSKPGGRKPLYAGSLTREQYQRLHWTEQQRLKPNSKQPKPYRETGDSDNRLDNWEVGDEPEDKQ